MCLYMHKIYYEHTHIISIEKILINIIDMIDKI